MAVTTRRTNVLPGFNLTLGFTLAYLGIVVLIPLSTIFFRTFTLTWAQFWAAVASPRTIAAYRLSFGASLAGALVNSIFGFVVAWTLVRYEFPGKKLIDVMVDLPFALPTSVAGITLTAIYAGNGWLGRYLTPLGIKVAYAPLGVAVALTFVGLPFVVRTVQPVLQDLDKEYEEAAATLGATRMQTFRLVIAPALIPALLTGFAVIAAVLQLWLILNPGYFSHDELQWWARADVPSGMVAIACGLPMLTAPISSSSPATSRW